MQAITPTIQAGNVYLPHPTVFPWVTAFTGECSAFPGGANDDQVDAMSQALSKLIHYEWVDEVEEPEPLSDEERWHRNLRRLGAETEDDLKCNS